MDRLTQLYKFEEESPNDPFIHYAIALELQKTDLNKALARFELLLNNFPDYLATYYHAGKLFQHLELFEQAIDVFEKGIVIADHQNNKHAGNELKAALFELKDED